MKARQTPWYSFVLLLILGIVGGLFLAKATETTRFEVLGTPYFVSIILIALGLLTLELGWTVHKYIHDKTRDIAPNRAANTLIIAKAVSLAGALLCGWYIGQFLVIMPHNDVDYYKKILFECGFAVIAGMIDLVCGIIAEHWCVLPPTEGPENPHIQRYRGKKTHAYSNKYDNEIHSK
ncbi:MAG: DUF3180 domain-containing protein [Aeriscardovia sp.]|nr:DUF3180 domain-containing protein [Aeriscardovia sp.]